MNLECYVGVASTRYLKQSVCRKRLFLIVYRIPWSRLFPEAVEAMEIGRHSTRSSLFQAD